ncbi:hypothetical protein [Adhaeribacter radiodurans]|uniref:Uncharacterized protein n=1 Tax=Adhaeribacter radiodurans TaxID=2745197 RepID=A0A7L7LB03_9BACT|nr:hypothetical protein [Adhaeribacter radiodurans]QMU29933.1 hypothetical protein HUW48_18720 [Adhaeribacter radiodurans]
MKQLFLLFTISAQRTTPLTSIENHSISIKPIVKKQHASTSYTWEEGSAFTCQYLESSTEQQPYLHTISAVSKTVAENSYDRRFYKNSN